MTKGKPIEEAIADEKRSGKIAMIQALSTDDIEEASKAAKKADRHLRNANMLGKMNRMFTNHFTKRMSPESMADAFGNDTRA